MAEPEVEAAWRAEFERSGATQLRDALNNGDGFTDELKRQAANLPLCQVDLLGCCRCCDRWSHRAGFVAIALRRQAEPDRSRCPLSYRD